VQIDPRSVGFDIDGVVADTGEAFIRLARERFGIDDIRLDDITEFMVEECLDIDPATVEQIFREILEEPIAADLRPMANAMAVLRQLAKEAPLTFITARPQREPIARWLRKHLGEAEIKSARLIATGEHDRKVEHVQELGLSYFIDDRAETCILLDRAAVGAFVYQQPWNQGKHRLPVVTDWHAIRALCFGKRSL